MARDELARQRPASARPSVPPSLERSDVPLSAPPGVDQLHSRLLRAPCPLRTLHADSRKPWQRCETAGGCVTHVVRSPVSAPAWMTRLEHPAEPRRAPG
jgi:hypothetical protein